MVIDRGKWIQLKKYCISLSMMVPILMKRHL